MLTTQRSLPALDPENPPMNSQLTSRAAEVAYLSMRNLNVPLTVTESELRHAMLSVYYNTVGQQFQISGAPSVMLPPEMQPMALADALATLASSPTRLREALWRTIHSVPLDASKGSKATGAYPSVVIEYLQGRQLADLDVLRQAYRAGANVFAAALVACRDDDFTLFDSLVQTLKGVESGESGVSPLKAATGRDFSTAIEDILGVSASTYLQNMHRSLDPGLFPEKLQKQVARIETEIGCSIQYFVESLADVAAFEEFMKTWPTPIASGASSGVNPIVATSEDGRGDIRVFPVCSIIRQDANSLVTTATVTTIVEGTFGQLLDVIDPAKWDASSDVVTRSKYVSDPFTLTPVVGVVEFGANPDQSQFLEEVARVSWDGNPNQQAEFHNVLNILTSIGPRKRSEEDAALGTIAIEKVLSTTESAPRPAGVAESEPAERPEADVEYNLCRSIDSALLWDKRAGGLLVNQGYIKLRPLGEKRWRVTMRKQVQFSDRTPYDNAVGLRDFGQLANYMAPATLTWWLECETYKLGDKREPEWARRFKRSAGRFVTSLIRQARPLTTGSNDG